MSRTWLIATTIILGSVFLPLTANAEDSTTTTSNTDSDKLSEMSKDNWLSTMSPMLPDLICKGFIQDNDLKKRFDEIKMTYDKCVTLMPKSATKCQKQLYANIPETINNDSAAVWGKKLGECIGKDFAVNYLIPK